MIRAVIFDFNGVLIDDESVHFALFRDVLAECGIPLSAEQYHAEYLGYDDRGCFEVALQRHGQTAERPKVDRLIASKAERYVRVAGEGLTLFPGASAAIASLAKSWPVAICSGALRAEIEFGLRLLGVRDDVGVIIGAEDAERCKPDPEGYLLALDALRSIGHDDLEAGHCLVFEDSLAGVESAKGAGMWVVGLTNTYEASELRAAGADAVAPGLEGVNPDWVRKLFTPEITP